MKYFSLRRTLLTIFILLLTPVYYFFYNYYVQQRTITAETLDKTLHYRLGSLSYEVAHNLKSKKYNIVSSRELLDRTVAYSPMIDAISIVDASKVVVSTSVKKRDFKIKTEPTKVVEDVYTRLIKRDVISTDIVYFEGNVKKKYILIFYLNQSEITKHFISIGFNTFMLVFLTPFILFLIVWFILTRFVSTPLELLRRYAYYKSEIPPQFIVRELEVIRTSMLQTFRRLDAEQEKLYKMSRTDSLSGLSNRSHLEERMSYIIPRAKRKNAEFALVFLDLDHFKDINDSLGHDIGDEVLNNIADEIKGVVRSEDVAARIGGDEFIIVLTDYDNNMHLVEILERVSTIIKGPWIIQENVIELSCSLGVAMYPQDGTTLVTLMKNADIAMYEAKKLGRAQYRFFTSELDKNTQELLALSKEMKSALKNREYELYYQPQVSLQDGTITGAEALLRWKHPVKGFIPPDEFIPIAEENGFIVELGLWILEEAFTKQSEWLKKGIDIKLSVNVAARQFMDEYFLENLKMLFQKYELSPSHISIEITEHVFMKDSKYIEGIFSALKEMGLTISLDDFGTGYSSLSYLSNLPVDFVKIDKSFMDKYDTESGAVFIETIIKMSQTLGMKVIAEGTEVKEQIDLLARFECEYYQGYYKSRPVPAEQFEKLFNN